MRGFFSVCVFLILHVKLDFPKYNVWPQSFWQMKHSHGLTPVNFFLLCSPHTNTHTHAYTHIHKHPQHTCAHTYIRIYNTQVLSCVAAHFRAVLPLTDLQGLAILADSFGLLLSAWAPTLSRHSPDANAANSFASTNPLWHSAILAAQAPYHPPATSSSQPTSQSEHGGGHTTDSPDFFPYNGADPLLGSTSSSSSSSSSSSGSERWQDGHLRAQTGLFWWAVSDQARMLLHGLREPASSGHRIDVLLQVLEAQACGGGGRDQEKESMSSSRPQNGGGTHAGQPLPSVSSLEVLPFVLTARAALPVLMARARQDLHKQQENEERLMLAQSSGGGVGTPGDESKGEEELREQGKAERVLDLQASRVMVLVRTLCMYVWQRSRWGEAEEGRSSTLYDPWILARDPELTSPGSSIDLGRGISSTQHAALPGSSSGLERSSSSPQPTAHSPGSSNDGSVHARFGVGVPIKESSTTLALTLIQALIPKVRTLRLCYLNGSHYSLHRANSQCYSKFWVMTLQPIASVWRWARLIAQKEVNLHTHTHTF